MIGKRLKTARRASGLSQRALAEAVGVSAMAISKYERDEMTPGSSVLSRLSVALEQRLDYFLRPAQVTVSAPAYRRRASMNKKEEAGVRALVEEWIDRYLALEDLVGPAPAFAVEGVERSISAPEDVERVAEELREVWRLGLDPIDDLVDVLEARGIRIGAIGGAPRFDALTFWINDVVPVVALKRGVPGDRARFSLAHELGHLVLQPESSVDDDEAANRFAGAFLVPRSAAILELGKKRHSLSLWELSVLKCRYGLSMKAWVHRAADLNIIGRAAARGLYMQLAPYKTEEPGDQLPFDEPQRLLRLAMRAVTEGIVSSERAEQLYGGLLPDPNDVLKSAAGARC